MSVRKDKNGSWMFAFDGPRGADGKRRQIVRRGFRTQKLATDAENIARSEAMRGLLPIQSDTTLKQYLETWLEDWSAHNVSACTHQGYELRCRTYIIPALGAVRLDRLNGLHIERFVRDLQTKPTARRPAGVSARSALHAYRCLYAALEQAVRWRMIPANPAATVRPPRPGRSQASTLTLPEVARVIGAAREYDAAHDTDYLMIIMLAVATGLRRAEICALRWQDVSEDDGVINVRQSVEVTRGCLTLKAPKSGRWRGVRIGRRIAEMLRQRRPPTALMRSEFVFPRPDGGLLHPERITKVWAKIRAMAGITLHFHDLRHTQASLLAGDVEMKVISDRLGHSNIGITADLYTHLFTGAQTPAAALVDEVLAPLIERAEGGQNPGM